MKGGVREIVLDFSKKQIAYVEVIASILLVLGIVFPANIPPTVRKQASTTYWPTPLIWHPRRHPYLQQVGLRSFIRRFCRGSSFHPVGHGGIHQ
jgi:hypothetical protein